MQEDAGGLLVENKWVSLGQFFCLKCAAIELDYILRRADKLTTLFAFTTKTNTFSYCNYTD